MASRALRVLAARGAACGPICVGRRVRGRPRRRAPPSCPVQPPRGWATSRPAGPLASRRLTSQDRRFGSQTQLRVSRWGGGFWEEGARGAPPEQGAGTGASSVRAPCSCRGRAWRPWAARTPTLRVCSCARWGGGRAGRPQSRPEGSGGRRYGGERFGWRPERGAGLSAGSQDRTGGAGAPAVSPMPCLPLWWHPASCVRGS